MNDWHRAWVLHHRPYRESSLLVSLFTQARGRIDVVARGARRGASRHRGLLQPNTPLLLQWAGRGPLYTLVTADASGQSPTLARTAWFAAAYLNELLLRLLAIDDAQPELWSLYSDTLHGLGMGDAPGTRLRRFERSLLDVLGYGLNLECEAEHSEPLDPRRNYRYVLEEGAQLLPPGPVPDEALCFSGQVLLDIRANRFDTPSAREGAKRLLGAALALYLGDRPLRSRRVLAALTRFVPSAPAVPAA